MVSPDASAPASAGSNDPPAAGPPWDSSIDDATFAFVDLEMTGLSLGQDRVIEVCFERVRSGVTLDRFETVVHPGERRGAEHVHGIDEAALAGAPPFEAIADRVAACMRDAVLVAHGVSWDLAFLRDELGRFGRADECPHHAIDTVVLARRALHLRSYGLAAVAQALEIPVARSHRAGDDVNTTRAVFERLIVELAPSTPRDLWEVRIGERSPRPEVVSAVESAVAAGQPVTVIYRPSQRPAGPIRMVLTALCPPHVMGYLLPSRGRKLLRLDRILRIEPDVADRPE